MTTPTEKQWGGRRANQTGRPPHRAGVKRVYLNCTVDPETLAKLRKESKQTKKSVGRLIDEKVG
tara:strand:- start:291 stop:482 length:192 start_codon:yes stop_codon:yes gene_type:complete